MPKKSGNGKKKSKSSQDETRGSATTEEHKSDNHDKNVKSFNSKDSMSCVCGESSRESSERRSLVEALISSPVLTETSNKSQMKRKKKKKQKKGSGHREEIGEVLSAPEMLWESVETLKDREECVATVNEDAVKISEPNVLDDLERELFNSSPLMNAEEEKTLREFLKTLEIVDNQTRTLTDKRRRSMSEDTEDKNEDYEKIEFSKESPSGDTIPEEIFEEFLENEEMKKTKDAIRAVGIGKTSPRTSPKSKRKSRSPGKSPVKQSSAISPPKKLYSYNGVPFDESAKKPLVTWEDLEAGIDAGRFGRGKHPLGRLDVILEEAGSDISDASVQPESKKGSDLNVDRKEKTKQDAIKTLDLQFQPIIKKTVKIYPLDQKMKSQDGKNKGYRVEPVIVETIKMSEDVVKIELPESESEGDAEVNAETVNEKCDVEIVFLDDDSDVQGEDKYTEPNVEIVDVSAISFRTNASDIKYIEDENESVCSSENREEGEDGTEADVESEVDSRRATFILENLDDDRDLKSGDPDSIEADSLKTENKDDKLQEQHRSDGAEEEKVTISVELQCKEAEEIVEQIFDNIFPDDLTEKTLEKVDEKPRLTTDEILSAVQLNLEKLKNSPAYSRQESTSSGASNSYNTAKYLPPYSRSVSDQETDQFRSVSGSKSEGSVIKKDCEASDSFGLQEDLVDNEHAFSSSNGPDRTLSDTESLPEDKAETDEPLEPETETRRNLDSKSEIAELRMKGNVKSIVGTMEKNINEILLSKLKVIECFEEPIMSEATWLKVLEDTKREMQTKKSGVIFEKVEEPEIGLPSVPAVNLKQEVTSPEPLVDLAERKMLSLPQGPSLLEKIGLCRCCSGKSEPSTIERQDSNAVEGKPEPRFPSPEIPTTSRSDSGTSSEMRLYNLQCWSSPRSTPKTPDEKRCPSTPPLSPYVEFVCEDATTGKLSDRWYGMPVGDSNVLLGLSPSQKKMYQEKTRRKVLPDNQEAAALLDLHRKFLERRSYHEPGREKNIFESRNNVGQQEKVRVENVKDDEVDSVKGKDVRKNDVSDVGTTKEPTAEDAEKSQVKRKSRLLGSDHLLAILQNATSDDFFPELNINRSVGSSCESHEVSLVQNQAAMFDIWQKQRKFGSASRNKEEVCEENTFARPICSNRSDEQNENEISPEIIFREDETFNYFNQNKFLKEFKNSKRIINENNKGGSEDEVVVTENLPSVKAVIKSLENSEDSKNEKEAANGRPARSISEKYYISKKGDIALIQNGENGFDRKRLQDTIQKKPAQATPAFSEQEVFKQKMYEEYMSKLAERYERRQQKLIKMSQANEVENPSNETKLSDIENEFINKVKERNDKLGLSENPDSNLAFDSFERKCQEFTSFWEGQYSDFESLRKRQGRRSSGLTDDTPDTPSSKRSSVQLILDATSDVAALPKHLQEFLQVEQDALSDVNIDFRNNRKGEKAKSAAVHCNYCRKRKDNLLSEIDDALVFGKGFLFGEGSAMFTPTFKATAPRPGVWSPARPPSEEKGEVKEEENKERKKLEDEPIPPVWTPKSAQASPVAERKEFRPVNFESPTLPRKKYIQEEKNTAVPPWQQPGGDKTPESLKTPGSPGLTLPRAPNPTVTLLQKAREGHLPRGAHYLNHNNMSESYSDNDRLVQQNEVLYSVKDDSERPKRIELGPKKFTGIGPTTKEGIPVVLRSEVTEENKEKWYKRMYESLHKAGKDEDYVTVKYRTSPTRKVGYQPGSSSGYQSEPETLAYDSQRSPNKYLTLDRRRSERDKENDYISVTLPRSRASTPRYGAETYRNQPGRIENYEPGHSSISELEAKQWWDEVLEIFDRWLEHNPDVQGPGARKLLTDAIHRRRQEERNLPVHKTESPKSFMTYALKESGYVSDPQHVFKRREDDFQSSLSPQEQKEAYRTIQKGGEVPLYGLRKPAPERPKDDTEIEYFPLSPTLTRIRVHKQNITPLSEFPFLAFPVSYQNTTFNYPNLPIGVCSSYSQVQIFPPPPPPPTKEVDKKTVPETVYQKKGSHYRFSRNPELIKKDQKFSVQLQNISGADDYVRIVPHPRTTSKIVHEYVNLPLRSQSCSPRPLSPRREISPLSFCSETCSSLYKRTISPEGEAIGKRTPSPENRFSPDGYRDAPVFPSQGNICGSFFSPEQKRQEFATFSDLKRTAPSIVPRPVVDASLFGKVIHSKPKQKKETKNLGKNLTSGQLTRKTGSASVKSQSASGDLNSRVGDKDKTVKKPSLKRLSSNKAPSSSEGKSLTGKSRISPDKRLQEILKKQSKLKSKVPLSESHQREKPLLKTQKRLKTIPSNLKSKEIENKKSTRNQKKDGSNLDNSGIDRSKQDILDYLSRFVESQLGSGYVELQSSEDGNTESCALEDSGRETEVAMNPIYDSVNPNFGVKRKVESDATEAFRSRSFSPDVRKKVVKSPEKMEPPVPPKRKSSKNNSTLRMWSKMMVSYPYHRSRLDTFDSNVKFLRDRLRRRLDRGIEDKENESEFGDDVETVRTVRRDKNGSMSIKTNKYVKISRPTSSSPVIPTRTYDEHGRRVVSESKPKPDSTEQTKARKLSDSSTVSKSTDAEVKKSPSKPKGLDTVVRSSTTYSVRNGANQEEDKRKSVKVTVAISSKGKEVLRKSASLSSASKKGFVPTKNSSSPCPSVSSYRSGLSGRSLISEKGSSISSPGRGTSPQSRLLSPNSSLSRVSSPSRSLSPGSTITSEKQKNLPQKSRSQSKAQPKKSIALENNVPVTMTFTGSKTDKKNGIKKLKDVVKTSTITKSPGRRLLAQMSNLTRPSAAKDDPKKRIKKNGKIEDGATEKKSKKIGNGKSKVNNEKKKKVESRKSEEITNEVIEGTNLVRTDSFFQNLFLRGPPNKKPVANVERTSSVLERARKYQRSIEKPTAHKSEPSLALVTFYLTQKKPVSCSKFKSFDREFSLSRSPSPYAGSRSQSFQMKLRRFDSTGGRIGEEREFASLSPRETSPVTKLRSFSEPPINRSQTCSPDEKSMTRTAPSEGGSLRTSPTPSRSPSCRRIQSFKTSLKSVEGGRDVKKTCARARSACGVDDLRSGSFQGAGSSLAHSTSSLNLSNLSDHAEYQTYVLELMHSTKKCERFRELHKFYSSLERMGELEKTASIGDLRPRMKNEEIIDYDRWKKLRTKERAEAELKTLVGKLTEIQKEKDLVFRTADIEAVRWKGDRGLRIKERSVEDLKEQFIKYSREEATSDLCKRKDAVSGKDNYKPLWRGSSIVNLATSLNTTMASHRGRPVTIEDLHKIEAAKERIAKKLGSKGSSYSWSSLSSEQVSVLKNQLSEIYSQELKKKGFGLDPGLRGITENFEITVPDDADVKSPGEKCLYVRCNSLLSKDQMYFPSVRRKEEIREETKKAESISALPDWKSKTETKGDDRRVGLLELPWKEEEGVLDFVRTQSEIKSGRNGKHPPAKNRSASKPLSENEKKRLSMTLSKEVLEKVIKSPEKTSVPPPRENLGVASKKIKKPGTAAFNEGTGSPRTCYSLEMSEDGKSKNDFLLVLTPTEKGKDVEKVVEEWANGNSCRKEEQKLSNAVSTTELESVSASSETSVKTVIAKNSVDVCKKVEYFEDLRQNPDEAAFLDEIKKVSEKKSNEKPRSDKSEKRKKEEKHESSLVTSHSFENLVELLGQERKYATMPCQPKKMENKSSIEGKPRETEFLQIKNKSEEFRNIRKLFEDQKLYLSPPRYFSASPSGHRSIPSVSSNDSIFSFRSRSVSPDPTKYYRAYLRMVKCGAVRKLCNKFESWEDLVCLPDKDSWLPPTPKRFASDPELTRDMLKRYGTDPTKVTVRGQEVGDVRWLRTKYEKDSDNPRGRSRFRRVRVSSPFLKTPLSASDRFMPRINVISKTAELQLQKLNSDHFKKDNPLPLPSRYRELAASPEPYRSLIDYTKEHGGYYYTGEVEKLRRKFEKLHQAEKLSILGQMYTSTPDVNELRDIAPYLGCSWAAHRYPGVTKTASSPELNVRRRDSSKKVEAKPRPHSSSPIRPKQPCSILKPSYPYPGKDFFANQKFDPVIHRPKYRYQPQADSDRRGKRSDQDHPDGWRQWTKPTVTFKEPVDFGQDLGPRGLNFGDSTSDSSRKYVESEVTIHYKSPVRSEAKAYLSEEELARRQAESMKRIYQEERRRKYLQELQDMNSRRHTDNFTPSQKSPIPLNRYDDFPYDQISFSPSRIRDCAMTEPVLVARGLYDFAGRRPRELAFRRGDIIFIIRRLDKNWCEGELNGSVGLFPLSYVEIIPFNDVNPKYGRARAKYDFVPQTSLELLARKGDMITLIRRIDENWFEGRIGERTGIIPTSYCHVLAWPRSTGRLPVRQEKSKPVAAPAAHSLIHNGKIPTKHSYIPWYSGPNSPGPSTASSASGISNLPDGHTNINHRFSEEDFSYGRPNKTSAMQPLNIRINPRQEPALYQVLFNHIPNNDDELELVQGETVLVVEKCEDGWYVGSNPVTGKIGIFPGTHVRRMSPEFV